MQTYGFPINVGILRLAFRLHIAQETGWHTATHKNIMMTTDERWKRFFFLTVRFHVFQRSATISAIVMFETDANWNWHTKSATNIIQLITFV